MFSILKRRWIDVFCYTDDVNAYEYFPIRRAREFIPQWWKDIPNVYHDSEDQYKTLATRKPTMKRCPGIIEYYKKGFMIPLWTDIEIIVDKNINQNGWSTALGNEGSVELHPDYQKGKFLSSGRWFHNKIPSPWKIETTQQLDFLYLQPHWSLNELNSDIMIPNGHISFYKYNHATNVQMFINKETDRIVNIKAGTPILHLVPLTEKNMKLHVQYDENRCDILNKKEVPFSFKSEYYTTKKTDLHNRL